ncbi:MAG: GNAT family N-acetyltransferase [bacterium]|nr:GNAT family N-acetyltransferase [bacterium]
MNERDIILRRLAGIEDLERHGFSFIGYESDQVYRVQKTETEENTVISLKLEKRDGPYVKRWVRSRDDLEMQKEVAAQGLSWGAFIGDRLAGVALLELREWNHSLHLHDLEVMPEFRGRSLGGALLEKVLETARNQKARVITLETQTTNYPAIKFYRRHGYQIDGVDLSLYTNDDAKNGEVALTMKLKL